MPKVICQPMEDLVVREEVLEIFEESCPNCGKFIRKKYLKSHIIICTGKGANFHCVDCKKPYLHKQRLLDHVNMHHQENPTKLMCSDCGKTFLTQRSYKEHLKTHEGTRFTCTVCSNLFLTENKLKDHKRKVHLKTDPQCSECQKVFTAINSLKRHVKKMHK